ncbi:MAG TPA: 50S ribosomal protein L22 [Candidatus Nanoarchaeia archaeon]|nr:50S ribosomal protein L22 [Candidatus Nanoarchaeia archaeon]
MTDKNNIAIMRGSGLPISTKLSVEICNAIRNKPLKRVKAILTDVVDLKRAIPVRRYHWNRGHKAGGLGSARYPVKASAIFLKLCHTLEANAENKGLNVNNLVLVHAKADRAETKWHYSRKGRMKTKNTNVELMAEEAASEKGVKK